MRALRKDQTGTFPTHVQHSGNFFSPSHIYPKLTINAPDDQYEQEADAMAEQVSRMPEEPLQRKCTDCEQEESSIQRTETEEEESMGVQPKLMRKQDDSGMEASPELGHQLQQSKGSGSPLPETVQTKMNQAFGTDFQNVRIHTGGQATEMSRTIQAKAFTHGSDIYFNQGQYQPGSSGGDKLLAHELTHVVQQGH